MMANKDVQNTPLLYLKRIILPTLIATLVWAILPFPSVSSPLLQGDAGDAPQSQADELFETGIRLYKSGQWQNAADKFKAALPLFQTAGNQPHTADTLYYLGETAYYLGNLNDSLKYYQQSLNIEAQLTGRDEEKAALLYAIGWVYDERQEYTPALNYYQQAFEIVEKTGNTSAQETALESMSRIYFLLGKDDEGERLSNMALNMRATILEQAENRYIDAQNYFKQGDYETAIELYRQTLSILQEVDNTEEDIAEVLQNIGGAYIALGKSEQALEYYRQALAIQQEYSQQMLSFLPETPARYEEVSTLNNIGNTYLTLEQYEAALKAYRQALEMAQENAYSEGEAYSHYNIAFVYYSLGQYQAALTHYQQSLAINQKVNDLDGEASTLHNIGAVYEALKQDEQALSFYQKALTIARENNNPESEALALNNIGLLYNNQGKYPQALAAFEQALLIVRPLNAPKLKGAILNNLGLSYYNQGEYQQALSPLQQALEIARAVGNQIGEGNTLNNLGATYNKSGNNIQAISYYKQAVDIFEVVQRDIKIEEFQSSFADGKVDIYESLIDLLVSEGRFEEAFAYTERARARAFLNRLGNQQFDPGAGANLELIERERNLAGQISALQRQIGQADINLKIKLEELQSNYKQTLLELKQSNPAYASLVSVNPLSFTDIQTKILDDQTALVSYFVSDEKIIAFALDRQGLTAVTLPVSRAELATQIEYFNTLIQIEPGAGQTQSSERIEAAQSLHQFLISPLRAWLQRPRLIIIPHTILHYVPFAALLDEDQQPLAARFILSTAPSASSLDPRLLNHSLNHGKLLAFGNPKSAAPSLPFARVEALSVARLYPQSASFTGQSATEAVLRAAAPKFDILHLAVHSQLNSVAPLFSALLLADAGAEQPPENDGRLEVREIFSLNLSEANIVILSACETALGEQSRGDELIGLSRAFLYAGSPAVIASLWPVEDEATAVLMTAFHRQMQAGADPATALSKAQNNLLSQEKWSLPYYWAGFTLIGSANSSPLYKAYSPFHKLNATLQHLEQIKKRYSFPF